MDPTPPDHDASKPVTGNPPEDWLPAGTRMGEFEILGVVGMGGFGIVYRAFDHDLEREVAVKEYMPGMLANRNASGMVTTRSRSHAETFGLGLRSFVNEARLLARFDHPALLRVFRFWEANGTAYMAMPFYDGQTLGATLKALGEPPSQAWLMAIIEPLLGALDLLHGQQVYHRDIAPDNILLLPGGMPVLLDFGAARRVITDRTQTLTAILKPNYAPIEQYAEVSGLRQGPWTDFYALAAVVYAALTGRPPAPAATRAVVDDSASFAEIGLRLRASHGLEFEPAFLAAWQRCLSIKPGDRPQNAAELRSLLGLPAVAPSSGGLARGRNTGTTVGAAEPVTHPSRRTGAHRPSDEPPGQHTGSPTTGGPGCDDDDRTLVRPWPTGAPPAPSAPSAPSAGSAGSAGAAGSAGSAGAAASAGSADPVTPAIAPATTPAGTVAAPAPAGQPPDPAAVSPAAPRPREITAAAPPATTAPQVAELPSTGPAPLPAPSQPETATVGDGGVNSSATRMPAMATATPVAAQVASDTTRRATDAGPAPLPGDAPAREIERPRSNKVPLVAALVLLVVVGGYFALTGAGPDRSDTASDQQAAPVVTVAPMPASAAAQEPAAASAPVMSQAASAPAPVATATPTAPTGDAPGTSARAAVGKSSSAPGGSAGSAGVSVGAPASDTRPAAADVAKDRKASLVPGAVKPATARASTAAGPASAPVAPPVVEVAPREPTPVEVCGNRNIVTRWACMKSECAKPQFAQLAECKEERERAEREREEKSRL